MSSSSNPAPPPRDRRQRVQAATTGVAMLKGLASLGGRASLTSLAREVGEPPAKVHRYLLSLLEAGMIAQDPLSQHYYLGPETIHIGLVAIRLADPVRLAEAPLARLREALGLTCFVAVMGNRGPTIVRFEEPALPVTLNVRAGSVLSLLTSATGRVFLSHLDDPRLREWVRDELLAMPASQRQPLEQKGAINSLRRDIRERGMAIVRDTYLPGISAVAAPIHGVDGKIAAVLTTLGPSGSIDVDEEGQVAVKVREEAAAISASLGWRPDAPPATS